MKMSIRTKNFEALFYIACILPNLIWALPIWGIHDFASFYASGIAASQGQNPYAVQDLTFYIETAWFTGFNNNLNPPTTLLAFIGFTAFDLNTAVLLWWAATLLCGAMILHHLVSVYGATTPSVAVLWCFTLAPFWDTLHLGQIYMPLAIAAVFAWTFLRSGMQAIWAGVLIGAIAAVKPNFLVWPVVLILAGHYRVACAAFLTFILFIVAAVAVLGAESWLQWLELISNDEERMAFPTNGSAAGFLARAGLEQFGIWTSLALLGATGLWALLYRPPVMAASAIALLVSLLASPIAWAHYALLLIPLWMEIWDRRGAVGRFATMALTIPLVMIVWTPPEVAIWRLTIGSLYFWVFLATFIVVIRNYDVFWQLRAECKALPENA